MADAAPIQVIALLETLAGNAGLTVSRNRNEQERLEESELPSVAFSSAGHVKTQVEGSTGQETWTGTFLADFFAKRTDSKTGETVCLNNIAVLSDALAADWRLGGSVTQAVLASIGGSESVGGNVEAVTAEITVIFCTAFGDFSTLI